MNILSFLNSPYGVLYLPLALGMLAGLWIDGNRGDSSARFRLWAFIILPGTLAIIQPIVLAQTTKLSGRNIDLILAHWDSVLFDDPSYIWAKLVWGHHWRMIAVSVWYTTLPAAICISTATARRQVSAFFAYATLGLSAGSFYWLWPALGPAQAIEGFPWDGEKWIVAPVGVCNGFPSLHTAVAVMGVLCAPRKLLAPWVLYSLGMVFCCVSTGQHWLVDCVAGMVVAGLFVFGCEYGAARWPFLADKAALDIEASGHRSSLAISAETEPPR